MKKTMEKAAPAWPLMRQGNRGANVSALQSLLNYHGASVTVDGVFSSGTYNAVVRFQQEHYLTVDEKGAAGRGTLPSLIADVQNGSNSDAAKAAQYLLCKFEYIDVNGKFGNSSVTAMKTFQKNVGISETGAVNATTWQCLFGYTMYPINISGTPYASVCTTNSTLSEEQMNSNARYVYDYLISQGFTKNAACGVMGNIDEESGFNPGVWEKTDNLTKGYGLVQWTPATNFLNWAVDAGALSAATADAVNEWTRTKAITLMKAELNYLMWTCNRTGIFYKPLNKEDNHTGLEMTFSEFKSSTRDAGTLALVFHDHYERSQDTQEMLNERVDAANKWYNML